MFVVPKGVEHKPFAEKEVKLLLIEPRGVLNTGHEGGDRTAQKRRVDLSPASSDLRGRIDHARGECVRRVSRQAAREAR